MALAHLCEIVIHLHAQPRVGRLLKANGHLRRHAGSDGNDGIKLVAGVRYRALVGDNVALSALDLFVYIKPACAAVNCRLMLIVVNIPALSTAVEREAAVGNLADWFEYASNMCPFR